MCKESGEKEKKDPREESETDGLAPWSELKTKGYRKQLRRRNKKVAENAEDIRDGEFSEERPKKGRG